MTPDDDHFDAIARLVLNTFEALPAKCKPRRLANDKFEWVPLAGLVVVRREWYDKRRHLQPHIDQAQPCIQCVAVATGMKCLSRDKISLAKGNVLHDWHAEILALRGFNRWVLDECHELANGGTSSWLQRPDCSPSTGSALFRLQPEVDIHMYVSSAPCGDASMELTMAAQEDSTPWTTPAPSADPDDMIGRGHFDQLGIVRRKPSRPDAPTTWSKSCSDKLALRQCLSVLNSTSAKLVDARSMYLTSLILPERERIHTATERAFGKNGRMAALGDGDLQKRWQSRGYLFKPFQVSATRHEFAHRKAPGAASSNVAALWTPHRQEALVNGVLMGRKQFDPRGASCVSRRALWQTAMKIALATGLSVVSQTYGQWKASNGSDRALIKDDVKRSALQNWRINDGDEEWTLDDERTV